MTNDILAETPNRTQKSKGNRILHRMWQQRYLYILLIPAMASLLLFDYVPLYGIQIAFKKYMVSLGITGSPWNNFANFTRIFNDPYFWTVTKNTIIISFGKIITGFPIPIILSLLFNELRGTKFKRITQSVLYLPNFISWIVIASLIYNALSINVGIYGKVFQDLFHTTPPMILGNPNTFRAELYISSIWKGAGWGMIIYLAAISGIDTQLYEAAEIDGAGRWRRMWYITLPSLSFAIVLNLIMAVGGIMNANFDQIFNLYSPTVYNVGDVIDTYVYRLGISNGRYDLSTAINLFKSVVNALLLISADRVAKWIGHEGFF